MPDNEGLTPLQKIVLFAFVSFLVELPRFIIGLIDVNTGLGEIRFILLYLSLPLALYAIHRNFWKRSLKFPHLFPFLLMVTVYMVFQEFVSPSIKGASSNGYEHFFLGQLRIYIFFLMLVNFGLNRVVFYKVIDYAFYSILLICLMTYVGYLGFYEISIYSDFEFALNAKPHHILQINRVSFLFVFAILLLIVKQLHEKSFSKVYLLRDFTVILMLFGMITINASRGAFLIAVIFVFYYINFLWRHGVRNMNIKVFIIFVVLVSTLAIFSTTNVLENLKSPEASQIALISRSQNNFTAESFVKMKRFINIQNAWQNFIDHPFTGVGYYSAAKRYGTGTRSNNQYLQLLASYGIIFFIIYIFYNYRLVIFRFSLLKRPEIALSLIYHAMHILFRMPTERVAILGYIAVYFYHESKSTHSVKRQLKCPTKYKWSRPSKT